jgi:NitT/TauT family transport system ATP-binding protein
VSDLVAALSRRSPRAPGAYLRISDVGKTFQKGASRTVAVDSVTLDVPQGSFLTIVGPSGCGKSTLLKMIAGLLPPTHGTVEFRGNRVDRPPFEMIYVFQQYAKSLFPWRTVMDNVRFGLEARGELDSDEVDRRCRAQLEHVGLAAAAEQFPWQLSGGMQQRVAIARALACEPDVLLMDEPFSALDALTRGNLQDLLLELWEELGLTVVFVTHDVEEAIYLSDRVAVLSKSPSQVIDQFDVDVARPRDQISTKESESFLDYRRELYGKVLTA